MTRQEAIEMIGIESIERLERENCEPTNRCGYNGSCQGDEEIEWSASITTIDGYVVTVYYYTDLDDEAAAERADSWDVVDFDPHCYDVV